MPPAVPTVWTVESLTELRRLRREGADLWEAAGVMGVAPRACDLALHALLGREPAEALAVLSGGAEAVAAAPARTGQRVGGMRGFLRSMFGGSR